MPELPEVETMCRGLHPLVGGTITRVEFLRSPCRPIGVRPDRRAVRQRMAGRRLVAVERVGKRVVLVLDGDDRLVIEPRMTGLLLLADPPSAEHLRLELEFSLTQGRTEQLRKLWYWDRRGLGQIAWWSAEAWQSSQTRSRIGPDALLITLDELRHKLQNSRRAIKVALLDQHAVAGIGNLYASEMLFVAGIHPARRCDALNRSQWSALYDAMRHVLSEAIEYEGSTLSDGTYRNALSHAGRYQNHHRVYARAGEPCPRCDGGTVTRIVQAQRSTFFCPGCQRRK